MRGLLICLFAVATIAMPYEEMWTSIVGGTLIPSSSPLSNNQRFQHYYNDLVKWLSKDVQPSANPYPYFSMIPYYMGSAVPAGATLRWESRCFRNASLSVKALTSDTYALTFDMEGHKACSDFYWIADLEGTMWPEFHDNGVTTLNWTVSKTATSSDIYDLNAVGFRVLMFNADRKQIVYDLEQTVKLFECFFTAKVSESCAETNLYFMEHYAGFTFPNRTAGEVKLSADQIHDGDTFHVLRLDGIDPMLAWAMGSTVGHTTVAVRNNGTLYVCESTTLDAYWPVNGVQCTEYDQWIQQCNDANMNIVLAPLSASYASKFDSAKAWNFFKSTEGLNYGFYNILYGWVDTEEDNYPCVPPYPSTQCLVYQSAETLIALMNKLDPAFVDEIFNQAMNIRLGTSGLGFSELLQEADKQGIPRPQLPTIIEEDTFIYNTTKFGQPAQGMSMVCCTFVCEMWKNGGVFDEINSEINCAEFTNWDDYSLHIMNDTSIQRPQACIDADPDNRLCQIMGANVLFLNDYDTKDEYAHMAEHCPSEAPDYQKPADC